MQRSISVVAFVLFMSPLGIAISPTAVSCVNQFVRQHFMKSGKCVKSLTGLAKNNVDVMMGSNDGAKKYPFSTLSGVEEVS